MISQVRVVYSEASLRIIVRWAMLPLICAQIKQIKSELNNLKFALIIYI